MKESGQLHRIYKKWGVTNRFQQHCHSSLSDDIKPLAMRDVFVVFIMLMIAMGASLVLAQLEILYVGYYG